LSREQMERCAKCPKFERCIITDPRLPDMDPEVVLRWLEENCPQRPSVRFVPIRRGDRGC